MGPQDIIEAMESTANSRKRETFTRPAIADAADMRLWRDHLLRFLEELDLDLTVTEIIDALEDYS
ncbi:hypothetical protein [Novosphingobium sp. fls2-241-R2A-195]|uniref:hypothetical protein n=1 Tax=Novosphingobium sp. fls2-241-R2A-195 TaxID=3040296 RepID=UPI00254AF371|nr:hypothetical protein [Novosphingobium sp. fls2-241-R2A-195]